MPRRHSRSQVGAGTGADFDAACAAEQVSSKRHSGVDIFMGSPF